MLLDLQLPQISGDAFFLALTRRWPRLLGRVVLMTGDPLPPRPDWPVELAGCPVLLKPFSLDTLLTTVSAVLADFEPDADSREGNGTA